MWMAIKGGTAREDSGLLFIKFVWNFFSLNYVLPSEKFSLDFWGWMGVWIG
jgi:hypothetical protein